MLNDDTARAVRRWKKRKVENICEKVYQEFYKEIQVYGTMSAEEILIVGLDLLERCTIQPLLRMGKDQDQQILRESIIYQIAAMLGGDPKEEGN